jgi:hypothetical protein
MQKFAGLGLSLKLLFRQQPLLMSLVALCTLYVGSLIAVAIMHIVAPGQGSVANWLYL